MGFSTRCSPPGYPRPPAHTKLRLRGGFVGSGCTAIRSVAMRKPLSIKSRTGSGIDTRRSLGYANEPDAEGL